MINNIAAKDYFNAKDVSILVEVFLIVGIFSGFLLAYTLGERFLPLKEEGTEHA